MKENSANIAQKTDRIFFALFPDQMAKKQFAEQTKLLIPLCGGRPIQQKQLHLTLLFLGNVAKSQIELLKQVQNISISKFVLTLNEIRYWKHNKIVFVRSSHYPAELFDLHALLRNELLATGLKFEERMYKPHATLIRKAECPIQTDLRNPIQWLVNEWFLVQSRTTCRGVDYRMLARWQLR